MQRRRKKKKVRRTAAQRARARRATAECRARQRKHLALYVVAINARTLDALVYQHYLTEQQVCDRQLVNKALSAFLWDQTHGLKFR